MNDCRQYNHNTPCIELVVCSKFQINLFLMAYKNANPIAVRMITIRREIRIQAYVGRPELSFFLMQLRLSLTHVKDVSLQLHMPRIVSMIPFEDTLDKNPASFLRGLMSTAGLLSHRP